MKKNNDKVVNKIFDVYGFDKNDCVQFMKIINSIYIHEEFQKRFGKEFLHHGNITLGEHIIEDAVVTYKMSMKYLKNHHSGDFDLRIAVIIAMLHDLYVLPWQNNIEAKTHKLFNAHGFRHPIEAVINASIWYPELFSDAKNAKKIVDGIIHHMFPFPVAVFKLNDENLLELKNYELLDNVPINIRKMMVKSTNRGKIGKVSFARSKYKEGKIMSKADFHVSLGQIKDLSSAKALLTGKNKKLLKK